MGYDDGFEFEDENQGNENSGGALRKARDEAAKRAKDLEAQVAKLQAQLSERNLKDVLTEKGLNPGLAKWISKDGIDGSKPADVDTWLTENAELIGYKPKTVEEQSAEDERAAAYAVMQNAQQNALPTNTFSEAASRIQKAESRDEIQSALNELVKRAP